MKSRRVRNLSNLPTVVLGLLIGMTVAVVPAQASVPVTACGTVISQPGNYVLASDLNCTGDGIDINAANVSVDLAGHAINGPCASGGSLPSVRAAETTTTCSAVGINIQPAVAGKRLDHVAVQGPGLIWHFNTGIAIGSADYGQIGQVTAAQNIATGIWVSNNTFLTLGANVVAGNAIGVLMDSSSNCTVSANTATGNLNDGIQVTGGSASNNDTLNNNNSSGNGGVGIELMTANARVYSNTTQGNAQVGIGLDSGASSNVVFNNSSSVGNGVWDLADASAACGTNYWRGNPSFTRNLSCVN